MFLFLLWHASQKTGLFMNESTRSFLLANVPSIRKEGYFVSISVRYYCWYQLLACDADDNYDNQKIFAHNVVMVLVIFIFPFLFSDFSLVEQAKRVNLTWLSGTRVKELLRGHIPVLESVLQVLCSLTRQRTVSQLLVMNSR